MYYLYKRRHIDKWGTVENPKTKPSIDGNLIYDMDDTADHCGRVDAEIIGLSE